MARPGVARTMTAVQRDSPQSRSRLDCCTIAALMAAGAALLAMLLAVPLLGLLTVAGIGTDRASDSSEGLAVLRALSIIAGVTGLGLIGAIAACGYSAQAISARFLKLFKPGLYGTAAVLTGLILLHCIIAILSIHYLMAGSAYGIFVLMIVAGAVAGVRAMADSFRLVHEEDPTVVGQAVSEAQAPELWKAAGTVATELKSNRPDHIVFGLGPFFFVTEGGITTSTGKLSGCTLFCSLPLARILTVDEFRAIVGHVLGYVRNDDLKSSTTFYPIYRGTAKALQTLEEAREEGFKAVTVLPAIHVFRFFLERFALAEKHWSRSRVLLADQASVEATSEHTAATALLKIHVYGDAWSAVENAAVAAVMQGKFYPNLSAMFVEAVIEQANPNAFVGLDDTRIAHPFAEHPAVGTRLNSMNISLPSVRSAALRVALEDSAAHLIPEYRLLEESLSVAFQDAMPARIHDAGLRAAGKSKQSPTDPDYLICTNCGSEQWKGYSVCEKCGANLLGS
jgi:Zn-dependent protease with chaperone function